MCTGPKQRVIILAGITFTLVGGMVVGNAQDRPPTSPGASAPPISSDFTFESRYLDVLGARMHYVEEGEGDPILFLHGNPTSSYLWRNIIPHVSDDARAIAVDLIGMGKSDKPDIEYRFVDHARYLDAFIEQMGLEDMTLVIHDWGSGLGFNYAANNEGNIKGIAFMESLVRPFTWETLPSEGSEEMLRTFRTPGVGEEMILNQNLLIERFLPAAVLRGLSEEELAHYREPYPTVQSRMPVWKWLNEIPISGEPADVHEIIASYQEWLESTSVPKLLLHATPGQLIQAADVERLKQDLLNLEAVHIGQGLHFVQEDNPHAIGEALSDWYRRLR